MFDKDTSGRMISGCGSPRQLTTGKFIIVLNLRVILCSPLSSTGSLFGSCLESGTL